MLEYTIIKTFLKDRSVFEKYYSKLKAIKFEKEIKEILQTVEGYYSKYQDHIFVAEDEFIAFFQYTYPTISNKEFYIDLIKRIYLTETSDSLALDVVKGLIEKDYTNRIVQLSLPVLQGDSKSVISKIEEMLQSCKTDIDLSDMDEVSPFFDAELEELIDEEVTTEGLHWRLRCLNQDIGQLRGGTLGHVFARPDTGKTTFLISEISAIVRSTKDLCIWMNNEERPSRLKMRLFSGVLGVPMDVVLAHPERAKERFNELGGDRIKLYDSAIISIYDVEHIIKTHNPRFIVIDQGAKVSFRGDKDLAGHDRLKELYRRFRELAKQYKVDILTVGQAGATAEGKKWLQLDDMDNSKTGLPGELDYAIGIGKINDEDDDGVRYIHLCKQKLNQGVHGKHVVLMEPLIARYKDI